VHPNAQEYGCEGAHEMAEEDQQQRGGVVAVGVCAVKEIYFFCTGAMVGRG